MSNKNVKYPECEKLAQVSAESQELGYFLEWLMQRCVLAEWDESEGGGMDSILYPTHTNPLNKSLPSISILT